MNIDPRIFAVEKLSDCVTGEAGAVTDGGAHAGPRTPVCSPGERVKKSKSPANSSSFPRKRESRGGRVKDSPMFYCGSAAWISAFEHVKKLKHPTNTSSFPRKRESSLVVPQYNRRRILRAPPPDSRFRVCEEIEKPPLLFVIPAKERVKKSKSPHYSSSFPRKRESRGSARKTLRQFSCRDSGLDSRFRGNDEVLSAGYRPSLPRLFGAPAVTCDGAEFLHTLFRGNDEVLLVDYCLPPRRIFDASVVICENLSISSHDRERGA